MPKVYIIPNDAGKQAAARGQTFYHGFHGPDLLFGSPAKLKMAKVEDGLANTFMVVEAAEPLEWTRPVGVYVTPTSTFPRLGGHWAEEKFFQAAMLDGSIRSVRTDLTSERTLREATTPNGKERPGTDW
jgi:hypothetical protein